MRRRRWDAFSTRTVIAELTELQQELQPPMPADYVNDFIPDTAWEQDIRDNERARIADLIHAHRFDGTNHHATPDTWHAAAVGFEQMIRQGDNP